MNCSICGHENDSDANYCANCNNNVKSSSVSSVASSFQSAPASSNVNVQSVSASQSQPTPVAPTVHSSQPVTPAYNSTSSYTSGSSYNSSPSYNSTRPTPYPYQQPYYYQPVISRPKQPFTITDAYIIIGFVLAIVGIFAYAFILLPTSIGFSIVGFVKRTNARTLGLSIAGIVVGVVACLIKIGGVLYDLGFIPDWLSKGIF